MLGDLVLVLHQSTLERVEPEARWFHPLPSLQDLSEGRRLGQGEIDPAPEEAVLVPVLQSRVPIDEPAPRVELLAFASEQPPERALLKGVKLQSEAAWLEGGVVFVITEGRSRI